VLDGPVGERIAEAAEALGPVVLGYWDNGIRHVSNNVRPIETPADLAGVELRTPPDPVAIQIFEARGANPTPMAFSELYIALQQGVVDRQANPLMNIHSSMLSEVQKFISLTAHKYEPTPLVASKRLWDTFSAEDQAAIRAAAIDAGALNRQLSLESDAKLRTWMEAAGVFFNEVDPAPFVEATQVVYDQVRARLGDLVDLVQAEAAATQ
jgi:TRAP-type transport system periplasmic protein